jgi:N-hydroxyarylamine O-acetyltransferase
VTVFDLEAYLARIGFARPSRSSGPPGTRPTLAEVHRAHVCAIPFENLDPRRGVPVSLEPADLERKLVRERRGGYCFEQNLLLKAAFDALGAQVELMLARVRYGRPPGRTSPRTHLVLRVQADGRDWHADAGFGRGTLLEPIPFGPGAVHEQLGWRYRVIEDGPELVLQTAREDAWIDLYAFRPEPVPFIDIETSNWFTCTHPRSPFVTGLIVSAQRADGTRLSLSDWDGLALTEETPAGASVRTVERGEVGGLIAEHFGLNGFHG